MDLIKSEEIFYNSKARAGTGEIYAHTGVFPVDLFTLDNGLIGELELIQFSVKQSYYNIDSLRNSTFTYSEDSGVSSTTVTITNGNYNVKELAAQIQTALNAVATALTWSVGYNLNTLLYSFSYTGTPAGNVIFTEIGSSFDLLGFPSTDSPKTMTATETSSQIVSIGNIPSVFLHCDIAKSRHIDDTPQSSHNHNNIFAEIPVISNQFFGTIYYEKGSDHSFKLRLPTDANGNTLFFSLRDIDNNYVRFTSDWSLVMKFNIYKKSNNDSMNKLMLMNMLEKDLSK